MRNDLKARLQRLEQKAAGLTTPALLRDGTVVHIGSGACFDAVVSLLEGEPHRLHEPLQRLAPVQEDPTLHDVANILWMLRGDSDES